MTNKLTLEERVRQLEDDLARMKRENDDTLSNLDTSNLGSGLMNRLNTMQNKTNTLAGIITVDGEEVTIHAKKVIFQYDGVDSNKIYGYGERQSSGKFSHWYLPNIS